MEQKSNLNYHYEKIKTILQRYNIYSYFLVLFLIFLGACIYIPRYMIEGVFTLGANVNYATDNPQFFFIEWSIFLQIVCLGPIFGLIYYVFMKGLLSKIDKESGYNRYYVFTIEILIVLLIILNSMGHLAHLGFDSANPIDQTHGAVLNSELHEVFVFSWYMDEWFGHTMAQVTYFLYLVLASVVEFLSKNEKRIKLEEFIALLLCSYGIMIIDAFAAIKSECGIVLLILHLIYSIMALLIILFKKLNPLKNPVLLSLLISTIFVGIYTLIWISQNCLVGVYPFYSSNLC